MRDTPHDMRTVCCAGLRGEVILRSTMTAEEGLTDPLHAELPSPQARRELLQAHWRWQLGPPGQLRVALNESRLHNRADKADRWLTCPCPRISICSHDLPLVDVRVVHVCAAVSARRS